MTEEAPARVSSRLRQKSTRAMESETTERLLTAARARQAEEAASPAPAGAGPSTSSKKARSKKGPPKKGKKRTYCVCKAERDEPMIECGECLDWFHFGCVGVNEEEAEKIHKYVCAHCTEAGSEKTTYTHDIESFPSPAPPSDVEVSKAAVNGTKSRRPSGKRKKSKSDGAEAEAEAEHESSSDNEDSGTEAEASEPESDASAAPERPPSKRARVSPAKEAKRPVSQPARKASASTVPGALPPGRQYVLDKMSNVVRHIFGEDAMDASAAEAYGRAVEATLFSHFKENVKGKDTAGSRYKAQFNLLAGALSKELRLDLKESILDGTIAPAKLALLTSVDLATAEQRAEMERINAENLRQTVRLKENVAEVRLTRDGEFEIIEDRKEAEAAEEERRAEAERRNSAAIAAEDEARARRASEAGGSPALDRGSFSAAPQSPVLRRPSMSTSLSAQEPNSPVTRSPSINLASAWGSKPTLKSEEASYDMEEDQDKIDLSDIVTEEVEYDDDLAGKEEQDVMQEFLAKPVGWTGGITNPAAPSPHTPQIQLRHISGRVTQPESFWKHLLPQPIISITGRVPTKSSLQYLSDRRLDRSKELVTVAFSVSPTASEDEKKTWTEMVEYHVGRDRHAIYHPYGDRPPLGAARELYLIPLRPGDATPELFDMIDNYSLPKEGRTEAMFVGVFVANREVTPTNRSPADVRPPGRPTPPGPAYRPAPPGPMPRPPVAPVLPPPPISAPPAPIPNAALQALMASLDPNALAAIAPGGMSPMAPPPFPARPPGPPLGYPLGLPGPPGLGGPPGPPPPPHGGYRPDYPPRRDHDPYDDRRGRDDHYGGYDLDDRRGPDDYYAPYPPRREYSPDRYRDHGPPRSPRGRGGRGGGGGGWGRGRR